MKYAQHAAQNPKFSQYPSYHQTSNISHTLVGNEIADHSDVVGAAPVGTAPTTSSFWTLQLASMDWAKTTARRDENHLSFVIWCVLYYRIYGKSNTAPSTASLSFILMMPTTRNHTQPLLLLQFHKNSSIFPSRLKVTFEWQKSYHFTL